MAAGLLSVSEFLARVKNSECTLLDVRSESEYRHAHIPGAVNLPILNDSHRKIVGTVYKEQGRSAAVIKGFELAGPLFSKMITDASEQIQGNEVLIYCWRGGMRSNIMAWMLQLSGYKVYLLTGGYKAYRNHVLQVLNEPKQVVVLGGRTGSGKTEMLNLLRRSGEQVIDLEGLACHRGSAFGGIGMPEQPTNEQFENLLAREWESVDAGRPLWLENESRHIGSCMLPECVYHLIRDSILIEVDIPYELRKERIAAEYGVFPKEDLAAATQRIAKRLGPQHTKAALDFLDQDDRNAWLDIVLPYYDKLYAYGTAQRDLNRVIKTEIPDGIPQTAVQSLLAILHLNQTKTT